MSDSNGNQVNELEQEIQQLKQELQNKDAELNANLRLLAAGESVAMIVHEVLNPITSIISKLQHLLDEESDFELLMLILNEWQSEMDGEGLDGLISSFREKNEDGIPLLEEDLGNLVRGANLTKDTIDFVHTHLKRTVLIINNLRELSRVESTIEPINVKSAFSTLLELSHRALEKRNIEMVFEYDHQSKVSIDENELIQVLHNITRNGMQAINKNGTITLSTKETPERLEIRVQDSGSGIPDEIVPKIFESRFTTKGKREGTGLGLTFSQRIMSKYQGGLELEDQGGNGVGATFLCWIPLKPLKEDES